MRLCLALVLVCLSVSSSFALSQECWHARSLGGPCGCVASEHIFGHSVRDLWKASSWYRFSRTSPHPGAVAIWGSRHVEAVVSVSGSTVTTDGPYGLRHTPIGRLVFVEPHGGESHLASRHHEPPRYASHHYRQPRETIEVALIMAPDRRW
jgi:hypothetical protein